MIGIGTQPAERESAPLNRNHHPPLVAEAEGAGRVFELVVEADSVVAFAAAFAGGA